MLRHPPDIVITTPESLYLMLTSQARSVLTSVRWVIVDEVHSVASSKRGSHLALSLERLDELVAGSPGAAPPQRIGLSATQRPLATIAEFLGGGEVVDGGWQPRPVAIVDVPGDKTFDLEIVVPVADMTRPEASVPIGEDGATPRSIWPAVYPSLLEQVLRHRSTIIFVNSRGAAERLAAELNRLAGEELAQSHHGSVSREQRVAIETKLKQGELRAVVATSTLELGIDMAAVDLVLLVESPASVASGLQRVGRAGHQVGAPSVARIYPKHRADLLEATVVVDRMLAGAVETTVVPRNPLDVLAQQLVAMVTARAGHRRRAVRPGPRRRPLPGPGPSQLRGRPRHAGGPLPVRRVRRAPPPHRLGPFHRDGPAPRQRQDAGRHQPGHHPRSRALHGDAGRWWSGGRARRGDGLREPAGRRVRPRIDVVADRRDNPRPGHRAPRPGPDPPPSSPSGTAMPPAGPSSWAGRSASSSVASAGSAPVRPAPRWSTGTGWTRGPPTTSPPSSTKSGRPPGCCPPTARSWCSGSATRSATGGWWCSPRSAPGSTPRGRWRPGTGSAPRWGARSTSSGRTTASSSASPTSTSPRRRLRWCPPPTRSRTSCSRRWPTRPCSPSRFREAAARALLLPRRRPGSRTPLWQQRRRAAGLLEVAAKHPDFPIVLETYREVLQDHFDLPALTELLGDIAARRVRVHELELNGPSPFASSLMFDFVASFMYEYDAPVAERRAAALTLDRRLLADLLGDPDLRDLLDPAVIAQVELELQLLDPERKARSADAVHDALRHLGPLTPDELRARVEPPEQADAFVAGLVGERRIAPVVVNGSSRLAAVEDIARLRDALGVAPPPGMPDRPARAGIRPARRPGRPVRPHPRAVHRGRGGRRRSASLPPSWPRCSTGSPVPAGSPAAATAAGRTRRSGWTWRCCAGSGGDRWRCCAPRSRRSTSPRSVASCPPGRASARNRARPSDSTRWCASSRAPPSPPESSSRPCSPAGSPIHRRCSMRCSPPVTWCGWAEGRWRARTAGSPSTCEARCPRWRPHSTSSHPRAPVHEALRTVLASRGASFFYDLVAAAGGAAHDDVLEAIWDLVWAGEVTNDTFAPVRGFLGRKRTARTGRPRPMTGMPPAASGRWYLTADLVTGSGPVSAEERAGATAEVLLDRHGVVTRDTVLGEGVPGGFSGLYPVFTALEDVGRVRRGYFIEGLGGSQFALPGAVDRLRRADPPGVLLLAAADPANVYGSTVSVAGACHRPAGPAQRGVGDPPRRVAGGVRRGQRPVGVDVRRRSGAGGQRAGRAGRSRRWATHRRHRGRRTPSPAPHSARR